MADSELTPREQTRIDAQIKRMQEEEAKRQKKAARESSKSAQESKHQNESSAKLPKPVPTKPHRNLDAVTNKPAAKRIKKSDHSAANSQGAASAATSIRKGKPSTSVTAKPAHSSAPQPRAAVQWKVGQECEANDPADPTWEGKYFNGLIKGINKDGTYHVTFNDGDARKALAGDNIRHRPVSLREQRKLAAQLQNAGIVPVEKHVESPSPSSSPVPKQKAAPRPRKPVAVIKGFGSDDESDSDEAFKVSSPVVRRKPVEEQAKRKQAVEEPAAEQNLVWVECYKCNKWRCWRSDEPEPGDDFDWYCSLSTDSRYNRCDIAQEIEDQEIDNQLEAAAGKKAVHDEPPKPKQQPVDSDEEMMFVKHAKHAAARTKGSKRTAADMERTATVSTSKVRDSPSNQKTVAKRHGNGHDSGSGVQVGAASEADKRPRHVAVATAKGGPAEVMIFDIPKQVNRADVRTLVSRFGVLEKFQMSATADGMYQVVAHLPVLLGARAGTDCLGGA